MSLRIPDFASRPSPTHSETKSSSTDAISQSSRYDFTRTLTEHGRGPLIRYEPVIVQVNVGRRCNQACHHCHVDAGPKRTEMMTRAIAERVVSLARVSKSIRVVDITGGAPELNPNFRYLVESARAARLEIIVRCNLTVLFEPGMDFLPEFYRDNHVRLVCSLPCYTAANVEKQRGRGVFEKSIEALKRLNTIGYGRGDGLTLDLVYNPVNASLPPRQHELEGEYRRYLKNSYGISFDHLLTITNMPINRFAGQLVRDGRYAEYMGLLVNHFNPATIDGLMCRTLISIGYDGRLFDCDFNQMLDLPLATASVRGPTIFDIKDLSSLEGAPIATGTHCFGCTAGSGSSCGGSLAD